MIADKLRRLDALLKIKMKAGTVIQMKTVKYEEYEMKKTVLMFCLLTFAATMFAGCGAAGEVRDNDKLSVVTTIFPEYDWVREIAAGNNEAEITMLLDNGVDLHSFQPTADDIIKVASCDMFIYVGGESDAWVEDALKEAVNKDMVVINLLDVLGDSVKEEEIAEGMEVEKEDGEEGPEYDEHVWLSLENAEIFCNRIAEELCRIDPKNRDLYEANAKAYASKLEALDKEYEAAVSTASLKTVLFGDRFPFRYMVDDYGLNYFAAFAGCSAESEASFETITFLAGKVDELSLPAILQTESADGKLAQTVNETTNAKNHQILTLDSMQSVDEKAALEGTGYIEIMQKNLEVLKEAID